MVPRKDIARGSFLEKVNGRDVITFSKDKLLFLFYHGLEEWTDPCNERYWPIIEEVNLLECLFKNEK